MNDLAQARTRLLEYERAYLPAGWEDAVQDNVWVRTHNFSSVSPGAHTLTFRSLAQGLLLERFIVDDLVTGSHMSRMMFSQTL